jgi:Fe2+ or Zn2+ uptake regulation protein
MESVNGAYMESSEVEQLLIKRGVKPTPQRMVIADYLLHTHCHPTADEVLSEVQDRLPCALSRATVYNTLNNLVAAGVIQEVLTESGKTRYDANVSDHHHFVDLKTGCISDIPGDLLPNLEGRLGARYRVQSYRVTFYGNLVDKD